MPKLTIDEMKYVMEAINLMDEKQIKATIRYAEYKLEVIC
jgi:hypothetical protein